MLKLLFAAQCGLGVLIVLADLPRDWIGGGTGSTAPAPALDVPIAPGNQTRRFEPDHILRDLPADRRLPDTDTVPSRLAFSETGAEGTVLLNGTIATGDAKRFEEWLASRAKPPSRIALNSPGGDVADALEIGRLIRGKGLETRLDRNAICLSACPYVLAGGLERVVSMGAFVGVHQHYFGENTYLPAFLLVSDIQVGQGEVMVFLQEMGIDPMMMAKALVTPPDDIYLLVPEELKSFKLATGLTE
jgi:hypothetical protein